MPREGLHRHAFWLYGVIVGLSIREALLQVLPDLIRPAENSGFSASLPEAVRLFVYLLLLVRFFLGSVQFFHKFYESGHDPAVEEVVPESEPDSDSEPPSDDAEPSPNRRYGLDFMFGFVHFLMFFGCTLAIDTDETNLLIFPVLIAVLLLYDVLWAFASRRFVTFAWIKIWALGNTVTVLAATVLYLGATFLEIRPLFAEWAAFTVVIAMSALDVSGLMRGENFLADYLRTTVDDEEMAA